MQRLNTLCEVEELLREIKRRIKEDGLLFMNGRNKNAQTLSEFGITGRQQTEIIDSITAIDYCGGPEEDEKYPWKSVSVFGKPFRHIELYIKFSIGLTGTPVVCLSFHESEIAIVYQFK
ncbi:MqsR (Motility quorum-sensing regulator) toxin of toxin-antitoxin system [Chitinophaga niastensis]|uniref:MqsR (Motility quorum-sensing regulator) toxin of toxin-antitoxin system n=1 Tax=Chitinophaga niastensis TaxID=536980 RepID=A0A2P8HR37_CHINA|nr:type II toxin-antitoxin system MqsR family toxin [Chitinophaga niastensis]PSL48693.1 MqsR (Motility quorum-sensing regulator) toxin of toxin-antitoxin system [Chitinophaga niastensis]